MSQVTPRLSQSTGELSVDFPRCPRCGGRHAGPAPEATQEELGKGVRGNSNMASLCCIPCVLSFWCCYIACCPPFPHACVRKLAFYPPPPSYTFKAKPHSDDPNKTFQMELLPQVKQLLAPLRLTDLCRAFYVRDTVSDSNVACIHFSMRRSKRREEEDPDPGYLIVFSHCNSDDIGFLLPEIHKLYEETKCDVVAYDYRGFGQTQGTPSEAACYSNLMAVLHHVNLRMGYPPESVVLLGQSLGSAVSLHAASAGQLAAGVIIDSAIVSGPEVFGIVVPRLSSCLKAFPNDDFIKKVKVPVLVIHGENDELASPEAVAQILRAAPYPAVPLFLKGCSHNETSEFEEYFGRVREFLQNLPDPPPWNREEVTFTQGRRLGNQWQMRRLLQVKAGELLTRNRRGSGSNCTTTTSTAETISSLEAMTRNFFTFHRVDSL